MIRGIAVSSALTGLALGTAWMIWSVLPRLIAAAGLQRYDLLLRVVLLFAMLSLLERLIGLLRDRLRPLAQDRRQGPSDEH